MARSRTKLVALGSAAALAATPLAATAASAHDAHYGWTHGKHKGWAKHIPGGYLNAADKAYLEANALVDYFEIAKANLAMTRSTDAEVLLAAKLMLKQHTKDLWRLKFLSMRLGCAIPTGLTAEQQASLDVGAALTGTAFDTWFIQADTSVHTTALAAARYEVANGHNKLVIIDARKDVRLNQMHLAMLASITVGS